MDAAVFFSGPHPGSDLTQTLTLALKLDSDLVHAMIAVKYHYPVKIAAEKLRLAIITQNLEDLVSVVVLDKLFFCGEINKFGCGAAVELDPSVCFVASSSYVIHIFTSPKVLPYGNRYSQTAALEGP